VGSRARRFESRAASLDRTKLSFILRPPAEAAISKFFILTRPTRSLSSPRRSSCRTAGVICHDTPYLSFSHPHSSAFRVRRAL
jgi:hypothetical protein